MGDRARVLICNKPPTLTEPPRSVRREGTGNEYRLVICCREGNRRSDVLLHTGRASHTVSVIYPPNGLNRLRKEDEHSAYTPVRNVALYLFSLYTTSVNRHFKTFTHDTPLSAIPLEALLFQFPSVF